MIKYKLVQTIGNRETGEEIKNEFPVDTIEEANNIVRKLRYDYYLKRPLSDIVYDKPSKEYMTFKIIKDEN